VFAVAQKLRPDYLGLVAESNLIRAIAPDSVYGPSWSWPTRSWRRSAPRPCRRGCT